jgi:DNA invertase Pin-like site-specific DNA recombinase
MDWTYQVYKDSASGKNLARPAFKEMLEALRLHQHDILLCSKVDRISRSTADFANFVIQLDTWGIRLIVLDQGIDTDNRNPLNKLLLNMLSIFAEFERDLTIDRIKKGMARARAKGTHIGGKRNTQLDEYWELVKLWKEKYPNLGYRSLAAMLAKERGVKVSWMTIKTRLDKEKAEAEDNLWHSS